jgi:hypothetical protein
MRIVLALFLLSACSSAGVRYLGVAPTPVDVDGWRIDVYSDGDRAQAIRMTSELRVKPEMMRERGRLAVEQATGCRLDGRTVRYDTNVLDARLICDGDAVDPRSG